uniref:Integrase catalytic domain-containing protein n=1 Tax=Macrostomum lignano TaxID=282301 RepID=A0A1I8HQK0_9PLAT
MKHDGRVRSSRVHIELASATRHHGSWGRNPFALGKSHLEVRRRQTEQHCGDHGTPLCYPNVGTRLKFASRQRQEEGRNWRTALDDWLLAHRVTPHSATGVAPAELLMGRALNDGLPSIQPSQPVQHDRAELAKRHEAYNDQMAAGFNRSRRAKAANVKPGSAVLRKRTRHTKIQTPFELEPWTVTDRRGDSYVLRQGDRTCTRHLTHIRALTATEDPPPEADAGAASPERGIAERPHPRAAKDKPISY